MQSFNHFLRERGAEWDVRSLLYHIARSVKYINFSIRAGNTERVTTSNSFGENQMRLDVMADKIISTELEKSGLAKVVASEEQETCIEYEATRGNYLVAFDPLDGSSLVDANLAIGSIFGLWNDPDVIGKKAEENMVAACYSVYGPRITFIIALKDKGIHEFELNDVGEFMLTKPDIKVAPKTKYFSPGNLQTYREDDAYRNVVDFWLNEQRTLRYSGGMAPDLNHIFCKGEGIFSYPRDKAHPAGKLRLLFECAPFAFMMREAGGLALNQEGDPILDTIVKDHHQTTPIFIGSKDEVEQVVGMMKV